MNLFKPEKANLWSSLAEFQIETLIEEMKQLDSAPDIYSEQLDEILDELDFSGEDDDPNFSEEFLSVSKTPTNVRRIEIQAEIKKLEEQKNLEEESLKKIIVESESSENFILPPAPIPPKIGTTKTLNEIIIEEKKTQTHNSEQSSGLEHQKSSKRSEEKISEPISAERKKSHVDDIETLLQKIDDNVEKLEPVYQPLPEKPLELAEPEKAIQTVISNKPETQKAVSMIVNSGTEENSDVTSETESSDPKISARKKTNFVPVEDSFRNSLIESLELDEFEKLEQEAKLTPDAISEEKESVPDSSVGVSDLCQGVNTPSDHIRSLRLSTIGEESSDSGSIRSLSLILEDDEDISPLSPTFPDLSKIRDIVLNIEKSAEPAPAVLSVTEKFPQNVIDFSSDEELEHDFSIRDDSDDEFQKMEKLAAMGIPTDQKQTIDQFNFENTEIEKIPRSVEVLDANPNANSIHIGENVTKLPSEEKSQFQSVEQTISEKPSRIPIKKIPKPLFDELLITDIKKTKIEETENITESKYRSDIQQEFDLKMSPEIDFKDAVIAEVEKNLSHKLKSDVIDTDEAQADFPKIVKPEVKLSPQPVIQESFKSLDSVKPVVEVVSKPKDENSQSEVYEKTKTVVPISLPCIESLKNSFDEDVDSDAEFELLEQALKKEEKLKLQEENQGAKNTLQNLLSANALKTDPTPFEDSIEGMIESDHDSEPVIESDPVREEKNESMSTQNDLISESIAIFCSDSSSDEDLAEQAIIVDHTLNTSDRRKSRISQDGENVNGLAEDEKCRRKAELEKEEISHKENETVSLKILNFLSKNREPRFRNFTLLII